MLKCIENKISIYSSHTALDSVENGVNDYLCEIFNKYKISNKQGCKLHKVLNKLCIGRLIKFKNKISLVKLIITIKIELNLDIIQLCTRSSKNPADIYIKSIAICAGKGGRIIIDQNADLYLTGEMDHHDQLKLIKKNKHIILCGHSETERVYLS